MALPQYPAWPLDAIEMYSSFGRTRNHLVFKFKAKGCARKSLYCYTLARPLYTWSRTTLAISQGGLLRA